MAEQIESSADAPENDATTLDTPERAPHTVAPRSRAGRPARAPKASKKPARTRPAKSTSSVKKPVRSIAIFAIVGGLVATVALPAFASLEPPADTLTLQEVAQDGAQSLVVASAADAPDLERETYSATTPEEIDKKKAEEAAAARARQLASVASSGVRTNINLNMVAPGSGAVRWPVAGFSVGDGFMSRGGSHEGVDLSLGAGNPIWAAAAGVVRVSQESYGGYGVAVTIDHVINGVSVSTLYGHMTYGSRQVVSGQTVEAGQIIGLVGSTGRSAAPHLHFEVRINGGLVDPYAWLQANAG